MKYLLALGFVLSALTNWSQDLILSGPMLGYCEMREVAVWVQTTRECEVAIKYWEEGGESDFVMTSKSFATSDEDVNTATLLCSHLEPGRTYRYTFIFDGKEVPSSSSWTFRTQPLWQWRTDPETFTLATGSCAYINEEQYDRPGRPYGGDYRIFESIANKNPDLMLWLGDNTYLREADWTTRNGILHRYTHTRHCEELQDLLSACHHYAIVDDHDYGSNDADGSFINKDLTHEAFELFWANPQYGNSDLQGLVSQFTYMDVEFFLLDNRTFRTPYDVVGIEESILGEAQKEWLIAALHQSRASFKIVAVGGQFLSDCAIFENHAQYEDERKEIIDLIDQNHIENVIFLTGDRHHTELSALALENGEMLYDFTCSPLTSKAYDYSDENNTLRVEGTGYDARNFATLTFFGSFDERAVTITVFDTDGKEVWSRTLKK